MTNPLLDASRGDALPQFDQITPEHVEPAMRELLSALQTGLDRLEASPEPTWEGVVAPLSDLVEPAGTAWGVVGHLMSVKNSDELRAAHDAMLPEVVQAFMRVGQSVPIYRAMRALRDGDGWSRLDEAQRRIVETAIRSAEHAGVALEGQALERFQQLEVELAELGTRFSNNVLDATKAFALTLTARDEVEGLPRTALAAAAQAAERAGAAGATPEAGPWRISLDGPSFIAFMEHARRRDLREQMYRAFVGRASSGPLDNLPVLQRILELRKEKAELLGFPTYAHLSLATKMAPGVEAIETLLGELREAALPRARAEHEELTRYARERGGDPALELNLWDLPYWAERMREERYSYTDEELRPYFALPRVLDGLFATAQRLFGVTIRAADGEAPVWHETVRFFEVLGEDGSAIASFYLDPYSRPETKRDGAWMDSAISRKRRPDASVRRPVAYLVCNQTPPVGDTPSLMTFREVETLFHEFGHGLHHMLTTVDLVDAAGTRNVEWDAVELPSQFMENWCYHEETLLGLARHYLTGEPLPRALFDKIVAAKNFRSGNMTARQVYFATLDLELHARYLHGEGERDVLAVQRRVAAGNTILPPLPEDRFLCSFSHIFAGGYAAGYYSYKWAEVLSADAFAAFEEAGLDRPDAVAATGRRFRDTVLALGGSRHPLEIFRMFRDREPRTEALLRHTGLREGPSASA